MKRIAIILGVIIDPNHFRLMLEQELTTALGRDVKPGDLKLSIFSGSVTATTFDRRRSGLQARGLRQGQIAGRLEDRTSKPALQQLWAHSKRCSLPHRGFQMESHRAPSVFRNLQKLGRRAS
jgi:hypothetical protein